MAGRLAALNIALTGTMQFLYTVPVLKEAVVTVFITNKASSTANVSLAITNVASVANEDYVLYQFPLPSLESYDKTAIVLSAGQKLYVGSSLADVNFVVCGFEDVAS